MLTLLKEIGADESEFAIWFFSPSDHCHFCHFSVGSSITALWRMRSQNFDKNDL